MLSTNKDIAYKVVYWYNINKRSLPFRNTKNPYKVWLSEIMLQQTKVATVIPYYENWVKKFPTIKSLSNAKLDTCLKLWEGLGYYRRCNNFYKSINIISEKYRGKIPSDKQTFLSFPGVGEYTASAVLSIAFNKPYPVLDGNVKRVVSRVLGIKRITKYNKKRMFNFLKSNISKKNPGDFNQGMMEIGSMICKPLKPLCLKCPLRDNCFSFKQGLPENYPLKIKPKSKPHYKVVVAIIWENKKFYIQKRNLNKMLGGLWEFPGGKIENSENTQTGLIRKIYEECGVSLIVLKKVGTIEHAYSHYSITLHCYFCKQKNHELSENSNRKWISKKQIKEYSFPKANHKLFQHLDSKNWYG